MNGKDKYGLTPLHYACMRGIVLQIVISCILMHSINNIWINQYVSMYKGNLEATRELLCAPGINVEAQDEQVTRKLIRGQS